MGMNRLVTLMIVIQLWQTTSGADPPPMVQRKVKVCFHCNDRTADFNWTHPLNSVYRIQWKFKDIHMANYTDTALDLSQDALKINQNYTGRFNLLKPGGVGFSLTNVKRADIGTYRCIVTLLNGVGETLEGVLEERYTDRQKKVEVCNDGYAIFEWTWGDKQPFSLIQWQVNGTTFANTTETGFSMNSLNITADYKPRFRLLNQGDVGFQLDHVSRNDAGTYTCIVTSQSPEFTIVGELEVKDPQRGDFNITENPEKLTCGETRDSTYSWIFLKTTVRENETSTGHELPLSSIPQKGSVYCWRHSDCTSSLPYNFSSAEVPEEGGSNTVAIVVPIVVIIIIFIIIITVIVYKRRRKGERISSETRGEQNFSGVEEQML